MADALGAMRERLVIQQNTPPPTEAASSLTRSGTTATVTFPSPHGFLANDFVTFAGAAPAGYNGKVKIAVPTPLTATFSCDGALATPATGSITAKYESDAQGGRRTWWRTFDTVFAEMMPMSANKRLQLEAMQSNVSYQFRIWNRADLSPQMRILWTPAWPRGAARHQLEITGILPYQDPWSAGDRYLTLQCAEVIG